MARLRPCIITCLSLLDALDLSPDAAGQVTHQMALLQDSLLNPVDDQKWERRTHITGNTILRVTPLDSDANRTSPGKLLALALFNLSDIQFQFAWQIGLIQGVITLGTVLDDASVIAGHGINRALALRPLAAGLPRLVLDPWFIKQMKTEPLLQPTPERSPPHEVMRWLSARDSDSLFYLDYLAFGLPAAAGSAVHPKAHALAQHAKAIVVRLRQLAKKGEVDDRARALGWLRRYHNRTVDRLFRNLKNHDAAAVEQATSDAPQPPAQEEPTFGGLRRSELRVPRIGPICYSF